MAVVPLLHAAIIRNDLEKAAICLRTIAQAEEEAYLVLERTVDTEGLAWEA
jgi:hypothetical protein